MAQYRIRSSEPRPDGSGTIAFDVVVLTNDDVEIPGRHATFLFSADDVQAALDKSNPNKELYKLIDKALPDKDWGDEASLDEEGGNNALAIEVDANMDEFAGAYPIDVSK